jgi:para-aminobenzoate synthetase component 1
MRYQLRYVRTLASLCPPSEVKHYLTMNDRPKAEGSRAPGQAIAMNELGAPQLGASAIPMARFGNEYAYDLVELSHNIESVQSGGRWAVVIPFSGEPVFARFASWESEPRESTIGSWRGVDSSTWTTSMNKEMYERAVDTTRGAISEGNVYQVNICRIRSNACDPHSDIMALDALLAVGNSAPYAGALRIAEVGVHIACASPELYLSRDGSQLTSKPIKGTAVNANGLLEKDRAENIMIVDLVRNDLSRCCDVGSVKAVDLLEIQEHPGLVHLVSTVQGEISQHFGWPNIIDATFPPGSIAGAPKIAALDMIDSLEPEDRGPYCGAFGWIDADKQTARLAVAIRTFWVDGGLLKFGTGAGITWGSDPLREWEETQLKARHLASIAEQNWSHS